MALSGLLTKLGNVSLMSGYVMLIVFSHVVKGIMSSLLEVNYLCNSLSRHFKDLSGLECFSICGSLGAT